MKDSYYLGRIYFVSKLNKKISKTINLTQSFLIHEHRILLAQPARQTVWLHEVWEFHLKSDKTHLRLTTSFSIRKNLLCININNTFSVKPSIQTS